MAGPRHLVGTVRRPGGGLQLAYAGHPLYRWAGDRRPGDVRGQAVGAIWFVVRPDGSLLQAASPTPATFAGNARTSLTLIRSPVGQIVADATGAPLYMFKDDGPNATPARRYGARPTGHGRSRGAPHGRSRDHGSAGHVHRPEGLVQLSMAGHPLYTFAGDLRSRRPQGPSARRRLVRPQLRRRAHAKSRTCRSIARGSPIGSALAPCGRLSPRAGKTMLLATTLEPSPPVQVHELLTGGSSVSGSPWSPSSCRSSRPCGIWPRSAASVAARCTTSTVDTTSARR